MDFRAQYPIDLLEAIVTPMIVRESVKEIVALPGVTLAGMRQLAEYAGFKYGAVRTALTRLKQKGALRVYDDNGVTRYELSDFYNYVTRHYSYYRDGDGFTLAVPATDGGGVPRQARCALQNVLCAFGFRKLSGGAYISGRMDISGLLRELEKFSLDGLLFLFDCDPVRDPGMLERIKGLWDLEEWTRKAEAFRDALRDYYRLEEADDEALYNRIFYAGPAFYKYLQRDFPRLSSAHFPGRLVYNEINTLMDETATRFGEQLTRQYLKINT